MDDGNRAEIMSKVKGIMKMEEDFNIKITRGTGDYKFLEWIKNKQSKNLPPKLKSSLLNAMVSNLSETEFENLLSKVYDYRNKVEKI